MKSILSLILLLVFIVNESKSQVNLNAGLVAYYPFNGNANDASGNNLNGVVSNGAQLTTDKFGNVNSAYHFDGIDDVIKVSDNGLLSLPTFTLAYHFLTESSSHQICLGKINYTDGNGATYNSGLNVNNTSNTWFNLSTTNSPCFEQIPGTLFFPSVANAPVSLSEWHCIVNIFENGNEKIYLDGQLVSSETLPFATGKYCSNTDFLIGSWWSGDLRPFKGKLDEVRVYNRAINIDEIKALCPLVAVTANFTAPDTVCISNPVNITNTSIGASSYYWNFCVADINTVPIGTNLGNIGGALTSPVYIDYVFDNGNYYGFVADNFTGNLLRLDFGNSLLNNPAIVNFGNLGVLPINLEGIQVVKNEGNWYAILVGGDLTSGVDARIMKVEFGPNITNPSPVASSWGNLGNMSYPHDLYLFSDNGNWYGFTANTYNNTITQFNFTNSFSNIPIATNLGNIGNMASPTGLYAINDNGNWSVFVTNAALVNSGTSVSTLTRLDFGSSLLNTPTGTNLGNPGNTLNTCWDISLIKSCGNIYGYVINATNELLKLDFNGNITNTPVISNLGNVGNLSFPHCLSKLFRVGPDIFTFVGNVNNSTITRIQFPGCTNSSIPASALQNPPPVIYDKTGTYNINLTIDDGLPTQSAFCKPVVVVGPPPKAPIKNVNVCTADSLKIGTGISGVSYKWNNGITNDSIYVKNTGTYWVDLSNYGCISRDSFLISILPAPTVNLGNDSSMCKLDSIVLNAANSGSSYLWQDGSTNQTYAAKTSGNFFVAVTNNNGCKAKDTVKISIYPGPIILMSPDTSICRNSSVNLLASGGISYSWSPAATLNNNSIPNPIANPVNYTTYYVSVKDANGCANKDSVKISIRPDPVFSVKAGTSICPNSSVQLEATGGNLYSWQPSGSLNNAGISNPTASPLITTIYSVQITDTVCGSSSLLSSTVTVLPSPVVKANKSNDVDCSVGFSQLTATGASRYQWTPAITLSNPDISNPVASPRTPTQYVVKGTNTEGCSNSDSILVDVKAINKGLYLMPSAFTPNNDGLNDCFSAKKWGFISDFEFSVFNRWGERVFHTTNPTQCWDGTYKGIRQKADVYVYIIRAKSLCEESIFRKGTVALIR